MRSPSERDKNLMLGATGSHSCLWLFLTLPPSASWRHWSWPDLKAASVCCSLFSQKNSLNFYLRLEPTCKQMSTVGAEAGRFHCEGPWGSGGGEGDYGAADYQNGRYLAPEVHAEEAAGGYRHIRVEQHLTRRHAGVLFIKKNTSPRGEYQPM